MLGTATATKKARAKYKYGQLVSWCVRLNGRVVTEKEGEVHEVLGHGWYSVLSDTGAKYRVREMEDGTLVAGD